MTDFVKKEIAALDAFQRQVGKYGLKVERSTSGHYEGTGTDTFLLFMRTAGYPVKGNKALLDQLKSDGFQIETCLYYYPRRHMVFFVTQKARIVKN